MLLFIAIFVLTSINEIKIMKKSTIINNNLLDLRSKLIKNPKNPNTIFLTFSLKFFNYYYISSMKNHLYIQYN